MSDEYRMTSELWKAQADARRNRKAFVIVSWLCCFQAVAIVALLWKVLVQ